MTIQAHRLTAEEITQGKEFLDDGHALVAAGDIDLAKYRIAFQKAMGRPTGIDNDALLTILGLDPEGDYLPMIEVGNETDREIEWFVSRVLGIEQTTTAPAQQTHVTGKLGPITITQENVNGFEYGEQLDRQEDITRYLRLVFNVAQRASESPEWKYADDVIADIVRRTPRVAEQSDEDYEDAIITAMTEFDPQFLPDVSVQDRINLQARNHEARIAHAAELFNKNENFVAQLNVIDTSNKVVMMSSISLYEQIRDMMSAKDNPFDFFGLIAEPGTEEKDVHGTNLPYDKYVKFENGKKKTYSEIDQIALSLRPVAVAKTKSGEHSENIKKKQREALARADKATEDATVSILKRSFREACSVIHQLKKFDRFESWQRDATGALVMDKDGNPIKVGVLRVAIHIDQETKRFRTTPKPVHIWEYNMPTNTGSYSVRQFIKFRPGMVPVSASLETLLADYEKAIEERSGQTPDGEPLPKNFEELLTKINYFANVMLEPKLWKLVQDNIGKKEHEELFSAVTGIYDRLDLILQVKKAAETRSPQQPQRDRLIQGANK